MPNAKPGDGLCDERAPKNIVLIITQNSPRGALGSLLSRLLFSKESGESTKDECNAKYQGLQDEGETPDCTISAPPLPSPSQGAQRNSAQASLPRLPLQLPPLLPLSPQFSPCPPRASLPGLPTGSGLKLGDCPPLPGLRLPPGCLLRPSPGSQSSKPTGLLGTATAAVQRWLDLCWTHAAVPPWAELLCYTPAWPEEVSEQSEGGGRRSWKAGAGAGAGQAGHGEGRRPG